MSPDDAQRIALSASLDGDPLPDGLAHGDRFRLLAAPERRVVVEVLSTRQDTSATDLDTLVDAVDDANAGGGDRRTIAIELHHLHLPMLDDGDLIEYDPASQRVQFDEVPDWATQLRWSGRQSN